MTTIGQAITNRQGEMVVILSETEGGVIVGWDICYACKRRVNKCPCADGPVEPPYVQKWRYKETTPDCRNQMGERVRLEPANQLAQDTVDRNDRLAAREHGTPTPVSLAKPTPQQMAERIATGLAAALLPEGS
ncbi:MAG: hypothetical protein ACXVYY_01180 [Oryzihumus sp.]